MDDIPLFKRPKRLAGGLSFCEWYFELILMQMREIIKQNYSREKTKDYLIPLAARARKLMTEQILFDANLSIKSEREHRK